MSDRIPSANEILMAAGSYFGWTPDCGIFRRQAPRTPMCWPRMKYRARRRHLGYTRTGGQR